MKKPFRVPVRLTGGIMHDTDYARGAVDRVEAAYIDNECFDKSGHMRWGAEYVMEEVAPFEATLRVVEAGHKNAFVWLIDTEGVRWPMFITDYVALMSHATVSAGWIKARTYEPCKKGARYYGIRPTKGDGQS